VDNLSRLDVPASAVPDLRGAPERVFVREETSEGPADLQFWLTIITIALLAFVTYMQTDVGVFAIGACVVVSSARRLFNALCGVSEEDERGGRNLGKDNNNGQTQMPYLSK
jgi:hypothetical protein